VADSVEVGCRTLPAAHRSLVGSGRLEGRNRNAAEKVLDSLDVRRSDKPAPRRWRVRQPIIDTTTARNYSRVGNRNGIRYRDILNKNSSGDEIANVNFYDDIVHVQARAYAQWTDFLISAINIYAMPNLCT